jgi:hypothetical protein
VHQYDLRSGSSVLLRHVGSKLRRQGRVGLQARVSLASDTALTVRLVRTLRLFLFCVKSRCYAVPGMNVKFPVRLA